MSRGLFCISDDLRLPEQIVTERLTILGMSGAGKTNTATVLVEEILKAKHLVCVIDPKGDFWGLQSSADGKRAGFSVVIMGGDEEHRNVPLEPTSGVLVADFLVERRTPMVLDLSEMRKGKAKIFVRDFLEQLYHRNRDPLHLVIDEADLFGPQKLIDKDDARMLGAIQDIVARGRKRGIGSTLITQRAARLNKDVLTQAEVLIAHRMSGLPDRKQVSDWTDEHGAGTDKSIMGEITRLETGVAFVWSPRLLGISEPKRVRIRERDTFDSSATPEVGKVRLKPKRLAKVDLERLTEAMKATVERAKADDPRVLRARIAELEGEVRSKLPTPVATKSAEKRVEVPVLDAKLVARLEVATGKAVGSSLAAAKIAESLHQALMRWEVRSIGHQPAPTPRSTVSPASTAPFRSGNGGHVSVKSPVRIGVPLRDGERRMLSALKRYGPLKNAQLAFVSCVSPNSFGVYGGTIVRSGLAERSGDGYRLTHLGEMTVADDAARPTDVRALVEEWKTKMRLGERKMLDVIAASARGVDAQTLSEQSGVSINSFGAYLGTLRRLGLVETVGGTSRLVELPLAMRSLAEIPIGRR